MFDMLPFVNEYATVGEMLLWANETMASRPPDFTLKAGYMHRWYILPRNEFLNLYLHKTVSDDVDGALHDHPWDSTSLILENGYDEETPEGIFRRAPGDVVSHKALDAHRLLLVDQKPSVSLFLTGPKVRDWGFHCPKGWVPWQDFVQQDNRGEKGAGCGESA